MSTHTSSAPCHYAFCFPAYWHACLLPCWIAYCTCFLAYLFTRSIASLLACTLACMLVWTGLSVYNASSARVPLVRSCCAGRVAASIGSLCAMSSSRFLVGRLVRWRCKLLNVHLSIVALPDLIRLRSFDKPTDVGLPVGLRSIASSYIVLVMTSCLNVEVRGCRT